MIYEEYPPEQGRWSEISEVTAPDRRKHQAVKMLLSRTQ